MSQPGRFRQSKNRELNITEFSSDALIPVHWLHTHAYCEYQLYLEKAIGIEAPPTQEMLAGSSQHSLLDAEHEKKAEIELTVNEAAQKAQIEAVTMISRDIFVRGNSLYGRIDEVLFESIRISPIRFRYGVTVKLSRRPTIRKFLSSQHYGRNIRETSSGWRNF